MTNLTSTSNCSRKIVVRLSSRHKLLFSTRQLAKLMIKVNWMEFAGFVNFRWKVNIFVDSEF